MFFFSKIFKDAKQHIRKRFRKKIPFHWGVFGIVKMELAGRW